MNPRHITLASLLLFFSLLAGAQDPRPPATSPTSPPPAAASQPPGSNPPITLDEPKTPPHRLTPEESKELLQSVDEIMRFASQDTLLPIKHSVKKAIVGREQVEKYLNEKFESDVDRIRFERSELVLKKFGSLPRNFELHDFLIKLLSEQVAGFYNEKSKTMNLLHGVDRDMQSPAMADDVTHDNHDNSYGL